MSTAIIQVPTETIQAITAKRGDLLTQAQALTIRDEASYRIAGELALAIKALRDEIVADFAKPKKLAHDAHKSICAQEKKHLEELEAPDKLVRAKLGTYAAEIERKRQDAEREAIAAATRKAQEDVINRAVAAEQEGNRQLAEQIMRGPVIPEAPAPVEIARPQASGVAMVARTLFVVTDPELVPRQFCSPDEKKIRAHVNAYGPSAKIPGVRVSQETVARIGGRIAGIKPADERILDGGADYADKAKPVASVSTEVEEVSENLWG